MSPIIIIIILLERVETEIHFSKANGMFKNKMDIDCHGTRQLPNNCQHLDPHYFSLLSTVKNLRDRSKQWYNILKLKVLGKFMYAQQQEILYHCVIRHMKEPLIEHIYLESCKISFRSCASLSKLYLKNVHYRLEEIKFFFVRSEQFAPVEYCTILDTICLRIKAS
jgi:hypothetical protein